jgi:hypothetical protein
MGFLNWHKQRQNEEPSTGEQLGLFGDSQNLLERTRSSGLTVRKRFTAKIQEKGGDARTQAAATEALTQEVLGCSTGELYEQVGATPNKRETLPEVAQEALMVGEVVSIHDLDRIEVLGDKKQQGKAIVQSVRESGKKAKRLFPW